MDTTLVVPSQMTLFYSSSQVLLDTLYNDYSTNSKLLISQIKQDKAKLSMFDCFNKRFKVSWGLKIEFTDSLPITREDTRACYMLMLKITDLWFAFEHLVRLASDVIPKDAALSNNSKIDLYKDTTLEMLGFHTITTNFNDVLNEHVLQQPEHRREIYRLLAYLKNNTTGGTQNMIADAIAFVTAKKALEARHIFALEYGIRNIYGHHGVAAALGSSNYRLKRSLYMVLYDSLVLYSLALGNCYCRKYQESRFCVTTAPSSLLA